MVYEIIPASSARFPWLNNRSRDRSPPRERGLEAESELYVSFNSGRNAVIPRLIRHPLRASGAYFSWVNLSLVIRSDIPLRYSVRNSSSKLSSHTQIKYSTLRVRNSYLNLQICSGFSHSCRKCDALIHDQLHGLLVSPSELHVCHELSFHGLIPFQL